MVAETRLPELGNTFYLSGNTFSWRGAARFWLPRVLGSLQAIHRAYSVRARCCYRATLGSLP